MGKTRDLFRKIRDTKGTFHAKRGTTEDRNSEQKRLRRGAANIQKNYLKKKNRKGLNDPDNRNHVITHLEPDILESEGKWALGSITMNKPSRGDRMPAKLFKILKDDAVKAVHPLSLQISKTHQWPQDWKR